MELATVPVDVDANVEELSVPDASTISGLVVAGHTGFTLDDDAVVGSSAPYVYVIKLVSCAVELAAASPLRQRNRHTRTLLRTVPVDRVVRPVSQTRIPNHVSASFDTRKTRAWNGVRRRENVVM